MSMQAQSGNILGSVTQIKSGCVSGRICASNSVSGFVAKPVGYVDYTGEYEVTPKVTKQTLQTAEKVMLHDVTIKEMPLVTTSNTSGGKTLIIGS